jgi:hypothetical protein
MTGPRNEMATVWGSRGHMRASHADREQVIDVLKAAFVQGRLAKDVFELRVGRALVSRTGAELAALTADIPADIPAGIPADIPAGLTAARPPRFPALDRSDKRVVKRIAFVTAAAVSLFAVPFVVQVTTEAGPPSAQTVIFLVLMFTVFLVPLTAVLLKAWFGKRRGYAPG